MSVDDATAARLPTDEYEPVDKPAKPQRRRKAATQKDTDDA
ncbi:MAG TPA: hypothetical protein VK024_01045 [Actinomycetaceae bacterium]|nr:hypothetical protein [Actinomycetaceae bacterium]